jgi:sulfite exporter TauE/SafE
MLQLITAGMALGLLGSVHCIGMCGPLALSLPVKSDKVSVKFVAALLYNLGRVVTYSCIGLLFGALGRSFALFGFQQWLSIIMGALILLYLLAGKHVSSSRFSIPGAGAWFKKLRNILGRLYMNRNMGSLFVAGMLNGLLPCGMVYIAVAGAMVSGNMADSMLFMASFGLGTLPLMWALAFFGNYMATGIRVRIRRAYPFVMAMVACLLILRGLGLGIPYVSPKLNSERSGMVECGGH